MVVKMAEKWGPRLVVLRAVLLALKLVEMRDMQLADVKAVMMVDTLVSALVERKVVYLDSNLVDQKVDKRAAQLAGL